MEGCGAGFDGVGDEAAVQGGELAAVGACEGQKITVGYLMGTEEAGGIKFLAVEDADVVRPKEMAREGEEFREDYGNGGGIAGGIGIALVAQNAHHGILGERASGPQFAALGGEPTVGSQMMNMGGIDKGNQNVNVKQEGGHGKSSRS